MTLSVCIQAGGASSRMGTNKALIPFLGRPLIQRVIERVRPAAAEILLIANDPAPYAFLGLPTLADLSPGSGPLGGLQTALAASAHPFVASVACDMPFVSASLLLAELDLLRTTQADVVIPETSHGFEPLHAVYRRETCLPWVESALQAGELRLTAWLGHAKVRVLRPEEWAVFDPLERAFININTPADLAHTEALARGE